MERRAKVELFEQIRREYEFGVGTVKGVARQLGVHRRMVRQALASAEPPARKRTTRARPAVGPLMAFIDAILAGDRQAPRKQRHTAHRIWQRLSVERPGAAGGGIDGAALRARAQTGAGLGHAGDVRAAELRAGPGSPGRLVRSAGGVERQARATAGVRDAQHGERGAFHRAYPRATQQAFLDAHEHAFAYFGGVFRLLRYDNLKAAVKKILRGYQREETARFITFRSHWRFQSEFCSPYEAHEKGGIEGEAGYFRRNHWVPIPQARDLAALNAQLLAACQADERRQIAGRNESVGELMIAERGQLLPLVEEGFELAEIAFPRVAAEIT
jgi:hypothetical protein